MSLIPYANTPGAVVLRRGNAVVLLDPQSRQLSVRKASEPHHTVELAECPYCHRPYHDSEEGGRPHGPDRPFVDPDYFSMLAARHNDTPNASGKTTAATRLFHAALRSGHSRDVSGSAGPSAGTHFEGGSPTATTDGEGISSTAFSHNYFKQHFREQGELGRGGNGVVLLVEHMMDGYPLGLFACKRIPVGNDHRWLQKVLMEVNLLRQIRHVNLVDYNWVWLEDYQPNRFGPPVPCLWILQQYCNGGDLRTYVLGSRQEPETVELKKQRMRRRSRGDPELPKDLRGPSRLTFEEILSFFRDITSGLHHLHLKSYIHRDLKPSNCLLQRDGTKTTVLISDFGEAQPAGASRGSTGATGTISYCAPEVLRRDKTDGALGNFTTASDIWSLGMIVYFLCFGRLPFKNADDLDEENEDLDQLRAEITQWQGFDDATRARPDLPERLYKFLKRLLSVDPSERPTTGEILISIRGGAESESSHVEESGVRVSSLDSPARRPSPQGRKNSSLSRPGLSTLSRRVSDDDSQRSLSPIKTRSGTASNSIHPHIGSRPTSPIEGSVVVRPRKLEIPVLPDEVPLPQSPRLMLPPPPERTIASRMMHIANHPAALTTVKAALFSVKMLSLFLPCSPYAAHAFILYPLLGLAAADAGFLRFETRRSALLLGVHFVAVWVAWQHGRLCEGKRMVWEDL